jgi:hypothetical protein
MQQFACHGACDSNLPVGIIQAAHGTLGGVQINGSTRTSTGTPANHTSSPSIINTTGKTKTVTLVVSDTDFAGPVVPPS